MTNQQNNERWVFVVGFGLLSIAFNDLPLFDGMNRFLVSGMVGAAGGIIGALLYGLVANKGTILKYGSLMIGACIALGIFYFLNSYYKKKERPEKKNPVDLLMDSLNSDMKEALRRPIDTSSYIPPKLTEGERSRLVACEVCGYRAVNKDSGFCYNCRNEIFDPLSHDPKKKLQWLKDRQIMWFVPDDKTGKVNFYGPKEENGFKKDTHWKPSITEEEVVGFNRL